jgi:hypothetical protein
MILAVGFILYISSALIAVSTTAETKFNQCSQEVNTARFPCPGGPIEIGFSNRGRNVDIMCYVWFRCGEEIFSVGAQREHVVIPPSMRGKWILARNLWASKVGDVWFTDNNPRRDLLKLKALAAVQASQVEEIEVTYDCKDRFFYMEQYWNDLAINRLRFRTKDNQWIEL